ncbi:putative reverse transcriptase domain-containing protein [Tanacetum coccineum]
MDEAYKSKYSVYPRADKMYYDLRDGYWWPGMKKDIAEHNSGVIMERLPKFAYFLPYALRIISVNAEALQLGTRLGMRYGYHPSKQMVRPTVGGVVHFGKKGKLAPRFVGPFEIIEKVGPVAYRLDLPEELNGVHDTFHVSNLKKCLADPTLQVPLDEIRVDAKLNFGGRAVENFRRKLKLKVVGLANVKRVWFGIRNVALNSCGNVKIR